MRHRLPGAMVAALLLGAASPALAQDPLNSRPSILVTGSAEVEAAPDQFRIALSVEGRGASQTDALRALAALQTRIMEGLPRLQGLSRASITTGEIALEPTFDPACGGETYNRNTDGCPVAGYVVAAPMILHGTPAERAGDAISLASELGAYSARIRDYSVSDMRSLQDAANKAAFEDAQRQARMLSEASGRSLVRILRIQDPSSRIIGATEDAQEIDEVVVTGSRIRGPAVSIAVSPEPVIATARVTVAFEIE